MAALADVDQLIEQYHLALDEFLKGNPQPAMELWSQREDISLANPYGPPVRGWDKVTEVVEHAASLRRDGKTISFETVAKLVTPELAYVVEIEQAEAKVDDMEEISPYALRVTMIFRREDGEWKVVHRHADPITTVQSAESVIKK
jgi:ketosteroid isomerase-like protein